MREAHAQGIDIFRIFDSLNSIDNMRVSIDAVLETGARLRSRPSATRATSSIHARPKYSLRYYVDMAKQLEKLGAHFLAIKDMAGLCKPYAAYELVKALREEIGIPIHFHTHDTSGVNAASILKAADAGVDIADAAVAAMSGGTSQPNLNSIVEALRHTPRDTRPRHRGAQRLLRLLGNRAHLLLCRSIPGRKPAPRASIEHEIPGGQYTNLREQAAAMGLGHRWREVETHLRRSQPAFRRHRQGHAVQQSRRRHDAVPDGQRNAPGRTF